MTDTDAEVLVRLFAALAARDRPGLTALLDPGVTLRALLPRRFVERAGAADVAAELFDWFEEVPRIDPAPTVATLVGGALRVSFRWNLCGLDPDRIVEQHAYGTTAAGRVTELRILCSGFRVPVAQLDALGDTCATLTPRLAGALSRVLPGDVLGVLTDAPVAADDLSAWSRLAGHTIVTALTEPDGTRFYLRRKS